MNDAGRESDATAPKHSPTPSRLKAIIIFAVIGTVLYVGWHSAVQGWAQQRRLVCATLLKELATTAMIYTHETGSPPDSSIETMVSRGWIDPRSTICPDHPGATSNYVIVLPAIVGGGTDNRTIIAYEPKSNHGDGGNIVFADGHSSYVRGADYDRLIASIGVSPPKQP